jgi:hypothetical protein
VSILFHVTHGRLLFASFSWLEIIAGCDADMMPLSCGFYDSYLLDGLYPIRRITPLLWPDIPCLKFVSFLTFLDSQLIRHIYPNYHN